MAQEPNQVKDGRLVRPELKQTPEIWRMSPHQEGTKVVGASYAWEPGDRTLYKMTVLRQGQPSDRVLVLIKEQHVSLQTHVPLTQQLFQVRFKDLAFVDNLQLCYQYLSALNYTDNIPIIIADLLEFLREINYQAFWPVDKKERGRR